MLVKLICLQVICYCRIHPVKVSWELNSTAVTSAVSKNYTYFLSARGTKAALASSIPCFITTSASPKVARTAHLLHKKIYTKHHKRSSDSNL
jgi:hypothetical protein